MPGIKEIFPTSNPIYRATAFGPCSSGKAFLELLLRGLDGTSVSIQVVTALFLQTIACHVFSDIFVFLPVCVVYGGKPSVGQLPNSLDMCSSLFFPFVFLKSASYLRGALLLSRLSGP